MKIVRTRNRYGKEADEQDESEDTLRHDRTNSMEKEKPIKFPKLFHFLDMLIDRYFSDSVNTENNIIRNFYPHITFFTNKEIVIALD